MKSKTLSKVPLALLFVIFACSSDESDYEKAKQANTIQAYEQFIQKHPDSKFVEMANMNIDSLKPKFEILSYRVTNEVQSAFFGGWRTKDPSKVKGLILFIKAPKPDVKEIRTDEFALTQTHNGQKDTASCLGANFNPSEPQEESIGLWVFTERAPYSLNLETQKGATKYFRLLFPIWTNVNKVSLLYYEKSIWKSVSTPVAITEQQEKRYREQEKQRRKERNKIIALITSDQTFEGVLTSTKIYPFKIHFNSFSSDLVTGQIEWTNEKAIHKIEGHLSGLTLVFTETEYIEKGDAHLGMKYTLSLEDDNKMKGNWTYRGYKGEVWFAKKQ